MITFYEFLEKAEYPSSPTDRTTNFNVANRNVKPVKPDTMEPKQVVTPTKIAGNNIRWPISRDMTEVIAITLQNQHKEATKEYVNKVISNPHPDSSNTLDKIILQKNQNIRKYLSQRNAIGMVQEEGIDVVGFMIYTLHNDHLLIEILGAVNGKNKVQILEGFLGKLIDKISDGRRTHLVMSTTADPVFKDPRIGKWLSGMGFESQLEGDKIIWTYRK